MATWKNKLYPSHTITCIFRVKNLEAMILYIPMFLGLDNIPWMGWKGYHNYTDGQFKKPMTL